MGTEKRTSLRKTYNVDNTIPNLSSRKPPSGIISEKQGQRFWYRIRTSFIRKI